MNNTDISKKYQKLEPIDHILKKPGMYVGGIEEIEVPLWILHNGKFIEKEIRYPPALYKIFDEIIVNAYDQTIRDKTVTVIKIDIDVKKNRISVYNNGKGIDVVMHPKEKIYVPELIFGHLMTSTNFDDDTPRITGGTHGLGAKLTAIFSKYFEVQVGDAVHKKHFVQTYKNNLKIKSTPQITNYDKDGYVKITFEPDLKYFKLNNISDDLVNLMNRRIYDIASLTKNVKVYLNGTRIDVKTIDDYVKLYTNNELVKDVCEPSSIGFDKKRWLIGITKSDDKFRQVSFVNGIYTSNGGFHVNYIINKIIKKIKEICIRKYKGDKIKESFIKDQLFLFIFCSIENPTFSSQTKEELITPASKFGSTCELGDKFIKKIYEKLQLEKIFDSYIKSAEHMDISKLDIKKKSEIKGIKKLSDANFAGTKKSSQCTLILTEGDSAKTMAITGLSAIKDGNDYYGVFPLRGKLLNVREASHNQLINNEEFKNIKNIMGLHVGKTYNSDNIKELRYSSILLMMDADVDGSHIKGLFINMMEYYWPSLLQLNGFIKIFITPIVKVSKNKKVISFFTQEDYNNWKKSNDVNKWAIKYYKGLGTNDDKESKEYFSDLQTHVMNMKWTDKSSDAINLAFSKKQIEDRKKWLKHYDKNKIIDFSNKILSYNDFVHKELIHFSNYDNIRSIPNIMDGLKPSQRKVLFGCFKRDLTSDVKVAQLVGYIGEHSSYHHGEISLANTIINMAQDFVGSNNINLLEPNGQFGSRLQGGKDYSSPRYIYTKLEKITRLIFRKEDDDLLNYLNDDGLSIEPEYYVPIIPIILVNGTEGIGTGYSTFVPKFNPIDIINNIKHKLGGQPFKKMVPWYNKFKGKINNIDKNIYYSKGLYKITNNILEINELPINSWTDNYKEFLDDLMSKDDTIKNFKNNSSKDDIKFTIIVNNVELVNKMEKKTSNISGIEKLFSLVTSINMNNMHLYDSNIKIKKYDNELKILEEFYDVRLEYYKKRKILLISKFVNELEILKAKIRFIGLVIGEKIKIFNKTRLEIDKILDKEKLFKVDDSYDYLIKMSIYLLTKEKIDELNELYNNKNKQYNILLKKSIQDMWIDNLNELEKELDFGK